jgi:2-dehydro-3-deoxygalactonokinase
MANPGQPALIGLDWGTSSLRGHLVAADGSVIETIRQPWGIQHLPSGGYAEAYRGVTGAWLSSRPDLPVLASGMVGSRQGWREAAYVDCPADAASFAAGLLRFDTGTGPLAIVPGLMQRGRLPEVMRGEETQIIGALAADPALAARALFILPGTHSKWAVVRAGRIEQFQTFMTGELFALLRDHSLLGRPAREADPTGTSAAPPAIDAAAFRQGVTMAQESGPSGIAGRLFTTRSLWLAGDLPAAASLDYLSGLLVGEEIRSGLAARGGEPLPPLVLSGEAALCDRYREALGIFGVTDVRVLGDTAAAGLWTIAAAAGLVSAAATSPGSFADA